MADLAAFYVSKDGDTVDYVVWKHYQQQNARTGPRLVEQVIEANPGLAGVGPILPVGTRIKLPVIEVPDVKETVRLWD